MRSRVVVLLEPACAVEAGRERRRAGAAGFRVPGHVRAVVVTRWVGRTDGVPLVSPGQSDGAALRGEREVVTEERHAPAAELLVVRLGRRAGDLNARTPGLAAVTGFGEPRVEACRRRPGGAVARRAGRRVVRVALGVVPGRHHPA